MKPRKSLHAIFMILSGAIVTAAAIGCATASAGGTASAANPVTTIASMLSGTFTGTTPGNELSLNLHTTGFASSQVFNIFVTAAGRYQGRNVRDEGVLHIESQGRGVSVAYLPHFDATVGSLSRGATRFTAEELESACSFSMTPRGDGYVGETLGSVTCARAIPGVVGKWTIEVEPGSIRLRSVSTGETLRFQRAGQ